MCTVADSDFNRAFQNDLIRVSKYKRYFFHCLFYLISFICIFFGRIVHVTVDRCVHVTTPAQNKNEGKDLTNWDASVSAAQNEACPDMNPRERFIFKSFTCNFDFFLEEMMISAALFALYAGLIFDKGEKNLFL